MLNDTALNTPLGHIGHAAPPSSQPLSDVALLVEAIVFALCDRPDETCVKEVEGAQATMIEVGVAREDHGKVIGKKGRTANAVREILKAVGGKRNRRFALELLEGVSPSSRPAPSFNDSPIDSTRELLAMIVQSIVDHGGDVVVTPLVGTQAVVYEVRVNPVDVRRLVGRRGHMADAIRELLTNLGSRAGKRFMLEVIEPDDE